METDADRLRAAYAVYLHRAWPMSHAEAWEQAQDVLAEVVIIALAKPDAFDPTRSPRAWLLGIGSKVILRYRDRLAKQRKWEIAPCRTPEDDILRPQVLFDQLTSLAHADLGASLEDAEAVTALLAPVSPENRRILRLAILAGLSGDRLAEALHCKPGTARVRLYRALEQLRTAWNRSTGTEAEGNLL